MKKRVAPPKHLTKASRDWWRMVVAEFELDEHHRKLLQLAAECWDRSEEAREILKTEGITCLDRFEQPKPHPAVAIERDAKTLFARLLRELALDVDEPTETPRPPRAPANANRRR